MRRTVLGGLWVREGGGGGEGVSWWGDEGEPQTSKER